MKRLAALLVVAALVSACGTQNQSASGQPTGSGAAGGGEVDHVTFAMPTSDPPSLFVPRAWLISTGAVMSLVQEGLLGFGNDLGLQPAVADDWEAVDPTTYVYHLRPGVKFSDGSDLTADDVVFSMELNRDPVVGSQLMAFYSSVDTIEATADDEITIKLTNPDAQFQYTVAHMSGFIFKKSQYEENPEDFGTPDVLPIGTGPYKVVSFTPGEGVELERNDNYWGERPKVARITIRFISDPQTAQLALRNGEIDGMFEVPIGQAEEFAAIEDTQVITYPSLWIWMAVMNVTTPPFDDVHVRRAVWYAIDRAGLVNAVLKGGGEPANNINPPQMWGGLLSPDEVEQFYSELNPPEFNLDKAREELAQSATPDGFDVDLVVESDLADGPPIAQSVAETLSQIGINVNVRSVEASVFFADYNSQQSPFYIRAYAPDFADPVAYPYLFMHSDNARKDGLNASLFTNSDFDAALDQSIQSVDPAERIEAVKEALTIADEEVPIAPIYWPNVAAAIRGDLQLENLTAFYYNQPWALGLSGK